jgi:hypothetical protein
MKILIFLAIIIYSLCLTKNYYQECLSESENTIYPSTTECRLHDPEGGYCCYLHYEFSQNGYYYTYTYYYYYKKKENGTNIRSLQEPTKYCYGISKEGFDKIGDVIDELSDETGINNLKIDCGEQRLKYDLLNILILLFIFFNL